MKCSPIAFSATEKGHDRARAAQTDVIAALRPEIAAARVQSFKRAGPDLGRFDKQQPFFPIDGKSTRISNSAVIAAWTEQPAITIEGEKHAKSLPLAPDVLVTRRGIVTALLTATARRLESYGVA
jgi:hypothetical protein